MDYKVDWLQVAHDKLFSHKFKRSVLKLDRNFHVYVHAERDKMFVEKDEKGTYLKLYFKQIL